MTAIPNQSAKPVAKGAQSLRSRVARRPGMLVLVVLCLVAASYARTPGTGVAAAVVLTLLLLKASYLIRRESSR